MLYEHLTSFYTLSNVSRMKETLAAELSQLGLTPTEAQVYVALLQNGAMGASAIAAATGLARTAVYPAVGSLVDKGLAHGGEGYGSRFSAVSADEALPHLLAADKEALLHRERLTSEVIDRISAIEERAESAPDEVIQVIRSPRAVAERFERLELEAEKQIDIWTKPPFFSGKGNQTLEKALRRGVKARSLYEKAALEDPAVKPYFHKWITAGEEARIYDGDLPHKLAIFDSEIVLMPLIRPGEQTKTLLIRHAQLAQSLSLAFQFVWDRSEPVAAERNKGESSKSPLLVRGKRDRNHQPSRA
jgi:sugar-specific transcriptional regulator TrmB